MIKKFFVPLILSFSALFSVENKCCEPALSFAVERLCGCPVNAHVHAGPTYQFATLSESDFVERASGLSYPVSGLVESAFFEGRVGFIVGIGFAPMGSCEWSFDLDYTFLRPSGTSSVEGAFLLPLNIAENAIAGISTLYVTQGHSYSKVSYNLFEAALSRDSFFDPRFALCPKLSLKSAWINTTQNNHFSGGALAQGALLDETSKVNFWGMGPNLGFGTRFILPAHFEIFGSLAAALLCGNMQTQEIQNYLSATLIQTPIVNLSQNFSPIIPNLSGEIGLIWRQDFDQDRQSFAIKVAYDLEYFLGLYRSLGLSGSNTLRFKSKNGNFGVQGLLVDLTWSF